MNLKQDELTANMKKYILILSLVLLASNANASCQCVCSQGRMQAVCDYAYERASCSGNSCNIGGGFGGNGFNGGFGNGF